MTNEWTDFSKPVIFVQVTSGPAIITVLRAMLSVQQDSLAFCPCNPIKVGFLRPCGPLYGAAVLCEKMQKKSETIYPFPLALPFSKLKKKQFIQDMALCLQHQAEEQCLLHSFYFHNIYLQQTGCDSGFLINGTNDLNPGKSTIFSFSHFF